MNVIMYTCLLLILMVALYYSKKILGDLGLKIMFILMNITSFILTFKYITLSTINFNANSISCITMFSSLYLLLDRTTKEEGRKITNLNFIISIFTAILLYLMTTYTQTITDTVGINMKNVFEANSRILIIYPITILLANHVLIIMYEKIKSLYDNMFISTVTTFLLVGLIQGILYTVLSYYNILTIKTIIELILATYMVKLIITVIYSILLMFINKERVVK